VRTAIKENCKKIIEFSQSPPENHLEILKGLYKYMNKKPNKPITVIKTNCSLFLSRRVKG